jgi:LytS/YehU family sensor histidine kinase
MRYGEQMKMTIDIQDEFADKMIAPLLLIPFVENSFKHGTSKIIANSWLNIRLTIENNLLHFILMNSRPQSNEPVPAKGNIGLKNVKKRLEILYPSTHELTIEEQSESFTVYLKLQLKEIASDTADKEEIKSIAKYATMA